MGFARERGCEPGAALARYFRIASHDVGAVIENLVGLAHRLGAVQVSSGPVDPAMRRARVCYDHLAGDFGVLVFDSMRQQERLRTDGKRLALTAKGEEFVERLGVDVAGLESRRRTLCLSCLDWSVRRPHLAGALGAALLDRIFALRWATRQQSTRVVIFSATGERALRARFAFQPSPRMNRS